MYIEFRETRRCYKKLWDEVWVFFWSRFPNLFVDIALDLDSRYISRPHTTPSTPKWFYTLTVHLYANEHPDSISRIKAKLIEASRVYKHDKETVDWIVMQDVHDPRAFTIVERFEQESSQKYHLENPYWKTFDPYVVPLLGKPMDLRRHEELDISKEVEVPA
ncbi:hypothetical protein DID88_002796 [Monilinia fructigena]|uniref:ABM domain-containing protein n=1 Tax=Monilinia fructigena TaxID=38457 RepID=A0A395IQ55_9HELO|nr:hypothetical protein DID88_002796 [Monilinia fructigena]